MATTTCQICGRTIKRQKNGRIAHHGYVLPSPGMKSTPCYGSSKLPYEQSCDAIKALLAKLRDQGAEISAALLEMQQTLPDTLTYSVRRGSWSAPQRLVANRPADFTTYDIASQARRSSDPYISEYWRLMSARKEMINNVDRQMAQLTERLLAWKPEVTA